MMKDLKLGYNTGYWSAGPPAGALESDQGGGAARVRLDLDRRGLRLGRAHTARLVGARTPSGSSSAPASSRCRARTPAATAMAAITLDHLSDGRFILGLGASGPAGRRGLVRPAVPEAARPHPRVRRHRAQRSSPATRPVEHHGEFYDMPLQGGTGLGKALKSTVHPLRTEIPIYLAAEGPKNVALAAEICDGWLPLFFSPEGGRVLPRLPRRGLRRSRRARQGRPLRGGRHR